MEQVYLLQLLVYGSVVFWGWVTCRADAVNDLPSHSIGNCYKANQSMVTLANGEEHGQKLQTVKFEALY